MTGAEPLPGYLTPGTVIGAYEVLGQTGAGGFGFLYRVRRDGRTYALKIGRQRLSELAAVERAHHEERLDREIAALTSLRHPNIVRVHSFERWPDLEGGFPYLVMDYVEGSRLNDWRAGSTPSLALICVVFEKIAAAVDHIHRLGIFHRDLKSANVLVRTDGEPIVIDFGIARPRLANDVTRAATVGTVTNFAPEYALYFDSEAFRNGTTFEWKPTTDLYAIGYMLYEVLTGEPPFPRGTESDPAAESRILHSIKTLVPKRPRELNARIPPALDDLVMRLLDKEPAKRLQTAGELVTALRQVRDEARAAGDRTWDDPFDLPGEQEQPEQEKDIEVLKAPDEPGVVAPGAVASRAVGSAVPPRETPKVQSVNLPSVERPRPFRVDGDETPVEQPASRELVDADDILKEAAAQFAASTPRRRRWPLIAAIGAVGLLLLLLAAAVLLEPPSRPGPKTLLSTIDGPPGSNSTPAQPSAAPSVTDGPLPVGSEPKAAASPPQDTGIASSAADAKGDGQIAGREGARHQGRHAAPPGSRGAPKAANPSTGAGTPETSKAETAEVPWLLRSQRLASASVAGTSAPKPKGVPLGAHIPVRLLTNLDTRTIGNGPVEAVLPAPFAVRGHIVLPARTLVYGTASESSGRFTIRFTRLRLPDDAEVPFEGIALARDDGKPGLAAARRLEQEPERPQGLGTNIAKGTGNILLDTVTGGTGQAIVRNAGQAALSHERPQQTGGQWALLLDAGVHFDIWVEHAF